MVALDARARKELKRIQLEGGPAGLLMEPSGLKAFVAVGSANGVAIVDLKALVVEGKIQTGRGPDGLAWATRD